MEQVNKLVFVPLLKMWPIGCREKDKTMNVALARSKYRQTEKAASPEVESPYQVILVTLTELEKSFSVLIEARKQERTISDEHINRCFTAIYILQSSLDFEKGGELATTLYQLYEYCRQQVLAVFRREQDAKLDEAREAIAGILSAWSEIGPQVDTK
jgi:flagellar protein FliS